jgi:hypothetical protein
MEVDNARVPKAKDSDNLAASPDPVQQRGRPCATKLEIPETTSYYSLKVSFE